VSTQFKIIFIAILIFIRYIHKVKELSKQTNILTNGKSKSRTWTYPRNFESNYKYENKVKSNILSQRKAVKTSREIYELNRSNRNMVK
jgi:hypothetical protein